MKTVLGFLRRLWQAETFSPTAFVVRACITTVLYGASELFSLREYTTFLSGTSGNVNLGWQTASVLGLVHLLLYVGFVVLVPILLIAAGLLAAWNRWEGRSGVAKSDVLVSAERLVTSKAE